VVAALTAVIPFPRGFHWNDGIGIKFMRLWDEIRPANGEVIKAEIEETGVDALSPSSLSNKPGSEDLEGLHVAVLAT